MHCPSMCILISLPRVTLLQLETFRSSVSDLSNHYLDRYFNAHTSTIKFINEENK